MPLPYQGRLGVRDLMSPTLIPQFYASVAGANGVKNGNLNSTALSPTSPAGFAAANPRTEATVTATITGTVATSDKITLTVTQPQLPGGSLSANYTTVAGDTLAIFAEQLATALNKVFQQNNLLGLLWATAAEGVVTVNWDGPLGNFAVLSYVVNTGAETVTLAPTSGDLGGGGGPLFVVNNFEFSWRGSCMSFYYGEADNSVSGSLLQALVNADAPVV